MNQEFENSLLTDVWMLTNKVHGLLHTFIHLCVAFSSKAVINLFISYNSVMGLYEYDEVPLRLDTVP